MIGRAITTSGSFAGYSYAENDEKKSHGETYNISSENLKEQWDELRMIASINNSVSRKKYVNALLSFDKSQNAKNLSEDQLKYISEKFAKDLGFFNNQWKYAVHTNTDELHIHFFANRIGFDGRNKVKAHNIGKRSGLIADEIAKEFGFKTAKQIGKERRINAFEALKNAAKESKTWEELKAQMNNQGYHFIISKNIKGLNGARIIPMEYYKRESQLSEREKFKRKGYKLSELSRKFKIKDLQNILDENNKYKKLKFRR